MRGALGGQLSGYFVVSASHPGQLVPISYHVYDYPGLFTSVVGVEA